MNKNIVIVLFGLMLVCTQFGNDGLLASAEKEYEIVIKDSNLIVEEYISGLQLPVMIDFIGNDMLILEKTEGTVRIVKDGILVPEPLIKIDVSQTAEEGLIGILVKDNHIFLHHTTKSPDNGTTSNLFTRYLFDGQKLVEPKEMLSFHNNESLQHNAGVMFTDENGVVFGAIGDTCFCDGLFQNNPSGESDNTSSIISLSVPRDIYAIGIRNTYGLDHDPITGLLWDTENGPESFDEVNLVEKKFNSGWNKIQGPIKQNEEVPKIKDFIYSDPEFSWERTIGITGIHFVESPKFPTYSNSVFIGSFHGGILYSFKLNEDRDGFEFYDENLQDLVLNKDDNANEIILATGFLGITDIKQGPDGLIYIVSIGDGKIFRLSPLSDALQKDKTRDDLRCNDFSGKDLSHCDFSGKDLSGKDLSGKDLSFVDFSDSSFNNVNFQNSNIGNVDFSDSSFNNVNFSKSNLNSAIFRNVEIKNTYFKESNLVSTIFMNSKLVENNFKNSDMERVLFSNSELYDINFENVRFYDSDFENSVTQKLNFKYTDMTFSEIKNSSMTDSKFDNARLWKTWFIDSDLENSSFVNSDNYYSIFKNTELKNSDFQSSRFSNVEFTNSNLDYASLLDVYPMDSIFNDVEFSNTKINTCLNHDILSRVFNKILRTIDNLGLEIFENIIIDVCNK